MTIPEYDQCDCGKRGPHDFCSLMQPRWHRAKTQDDLESFFLSVLPKIRAAARKCGYAIGVHGSMRRDLDLIAAPWVADHADKDTLAREIHLAACGMTQSSYNWTSVPMKPCGRVGTVFPVCWSEYDAPSAGHIDLAVMPDVDK